MSLWHYIFLHFYLFTYVQLQHDHVASNPKKESHMAYMLYSNYSKLAVGKFCHFSMASSLDSINHTLLNTTFGLEER